MSALFDAYIMVDWSAASKPTTGENSIWIGSLRRGENGATLYASSNPPTRDQAERELVDQLDQFSKGGQKVLLGFDFAFGYPSGTSAALHLDRTDAAPWQAFHHHLTEQIEDSENNANNRFEFAAGLNARLTGTAHPFWGVPAKQQSETLHPKKGDFGHPTSLAEHRKAEAWIREHFQGSPKSVWQLAYVGSVGSQALLGIPTLTRLRRRYIESRLWPFETGLKTLTHRDLSNCSLLIAEIYPSILDAEPMPDEVKDSAQVRALAQHFFEADEAGLLGAAFSGDNSLSARKRTQIEQEEGWILAI